MFPRISGFRHTGDYRLELSFTDGTKHELDFKERIAGQGECLLRSRIYISSSRSG